MIKLVLLFILLGTCHVNGQSTTTHEPTTETQPVPPANPTVKPTEHPGPESCCHGFTFDRNMDMCYLDMVSDTVFDLQ